MTNYTYCPTCGARNDGERGLDFDVHAKLAKQDKALKTALLALGQLACLGNGETPGNSIGNEIAQIALSKVSAILQV